MGKRDRWHHCNKDFKIVDLVTDASSMIIALIRTLKRQCLLSTVAIAKALSIDVVKCFGI